MERYLQGGKRSKAARRFAPRGCHHAPLQPASQAIDGGHRKLLSCSMSNLINLHQSATEWCRACCLPLGSANAKLLMKAIPLLFLTVVSGNGYAQSPEETPVVVSQVVERQISESVTLVGTVEPRTRSTVASEVSGIVKEAPIEEGDWVRKGQELVCLDVTQRKLKLKAAEELLNRYQQEMAKLHTGTRPEEKDQAHAAMLEAEAEQRLAHRELKRIQDLYARQFSPLQNLNEAQARAEAADQKVQQTQAAYKLALEGPRKEDIAQAEAMYRAQKAEVERLHDEIRKATVVAPFDGTVIEKHVQVGQWVGEGGPVVEMVDLSTVHVVVPVPERYISAVEKGKPADAAFDALGGKTFKGKVIQVIPQGDVDTRTFPVKVEIPNTDSFIKGGMFTRITLQAGAPRTALLVPKDAVVTQGPAHVVFVVEEGVARMVAVMVGNAFDDMVEVTGEVKPGQVVVIRGNERIRDGQPVKALNEE